MTRRSRDVVVAAAFAALALLFLVEGSNLPLVSRGIPGPGLFPLLLAVAILVCSGALAAQAFLGQRRERTSVLSPPSGNEPTSMDSEDETGFMAEAGDEERRSVLRPLLLWVVVLLTSIGLPVIGFLPATLLLTLLLLLGLERRFDVATLVSAVAVPVACYVLFAVLLDVRLPTGLFE